MITAVEETIKKVKEILGEDHAYEAECFEAAYRCNLDIVAKPEEDGSIFLLTGDIPAMWLRDSACQVRPYLSIAKESEEISNLIEGIIKKQMYCINLDPYANAFMKNLDDESIWANDGVTMLPGVWERKYEIDSLCFPFKLAYDYWKATGNDKIFDDAFRKAAENVYNVFRTEQYHETKSEYRFERQECPYIDSLSRHGKGAYVEDGVGLIWSGFRPSDDGCVYGYLIPSNMFAVVILEELAEIFAMFYDCVEAADDGVASKCVGAAEFSALATEVRTSIETFAVVPTGSARFDKPFYAYEVDGAGQYLVMDDANFPNLLCAPYLGYCKADESLYVETKKRLLSVENPYYYSGSKASGVGSIHTKAGYVWPLSLGMQGLVSDDKEEKLALIKKMSSLDADTKLMHECVNVEDPYDFTRPLFGWANAVFAELVLDYCDLL